MKPADIARMDDFFATNAYDNEPEVITGPDVEFDPEDGAAAGVLYISGDRMLLVKRNGGDESGTWAIPAGGVEEGETAEAAAVREFGEETQHTITTPLLGPYTFLNDDGLRFDAFVTQGPRFAPILDREHSTYKWVGLGDVLPEPVHPGLTKLFTMLEE